MELYHRTTQERAEKILSGGFRDGRGRYGVLGAVSEYSGVWVSDVPLDVNEGAEGDVLFRIHLDLPEDDLAYYEWVEDGKCYREWLVPADVLNGHGRLEVVPEEGQITFTDERGDRWLADATGDVISTEMRGPNETEFTPSIPYHILLFTKLSTGERRRGSLRGPLLDAGDRDLRRALHGSDPE